jgi:dTMP kinase
MYIIFEGIDTSGKSTQIERLSLKHPDAVVTKEPGGTVFGQKARSILLAGDILSPRAEMLLFLSDRSEHYDEIVAPNRDKVVLSDRGFLSGVGYALTGGDSSLEELIALNHFALRGDWPEHIIFFRTDMDTLQKRMDKKVADGIEQRGFEYLMEVQANMEYALEKIGIPYLIVNAADREEAIHMSITSYLGL